MNTHDVPRVLIVGHSFISHLVTDIQLIPRLHSNFNLIQCTVRCCGISGARINTIMQNYTLVSCLSDYKLHIVLLQIGGNDICNHHLHPETLAFQICWFYVTDKLQCITSFNMWTCLPSQSKRYASRYVWAEKMHGE